MKKANKTNNGDNDTLPEYDFTGRKGVRGKYYRIRQNGYTVRIHNEDGTITERRYGPSITLDPDVAIYFPDSESVNNALRALISLAPKKQTAEKKTKYVVRKKASRKSTNGN